jgi:hypothetical protein
LPRRRDECNKYYFAVCKSLESLIERFVERLSQVLCRECFMFVPVVDRGFSGPDGFGH